MALNPKSVYTKSGMDCLKSLAFIAVRPNTDRRTEGRTEGRTDGWTDGRTDRQTAQVMTVPSGPLRGRG